MAKVSAYTYGIPYTHKTIDFTDKLAGQRQYSDYMLARACRIFEWEGLPDEIPSRHMELLLQINGFACIAEYQSKLYAFFGALGGFPDYNYMPTLCIVSNPALHLSKEYRINSDCIIGRNDSMYLGTMPMFARYASMLAENDASIRIADINSRMVSIISAGDDSTHASAEKYLRDVELGKMGIIAENALLEALRSQPYGQSGQNHISPLIELQQYLKASCFNDIGLSANYNMKREAINSSEANMGQDSQITLAMDMLKSRQELCEDVNRMFGTNWSVRFSEIWQRNLDVLENDVNTEKAESEEAEAEEKAIEGQEAAEDEISE